MKERFAPFLVLLEARYAPLLFAVAPQAYAVYLWLFPLPYSITGEVFAVMGALGYELVYVGAIAWAEEDRFSFWTWATAVVALVFSVLVAYHMYQAQGAWAWLHAGFPLVAFSYTLNMYSKRSASADLATAYTPLETLPERSRSLKSSEVDNDAAEPATAQGQALLDELLALPLETAQVEEEPPSAPLEPVVLHRYYCPHCKQPLKSKQAVGAAASNGYCLGCKAERLAA